MSSPVIVIAQLEAIGQPVTGVEDPDGQPVSDGCVLGWAFNDRRSAS